MSDSYQAIYDAVRSRISGGNVGEAIERVAFQQFDISHSQVMIRDRLAGVLYDYGEPSAIYRPKLSIDGSYWCALYGENLQDGVAGFGKSPGEAMADFNKAWVKRLPDTKNAADEIEGIRSDLREMIQPDDQFGVGA